jgi:4a-hydroxytetrahydrobiopterin dehydratase
MEDLTSKRCLACEGGQPPLKPSEVQELLLQVPNWRLHENKDSISRRFAFKGFQKNISFINAVAWIVNQENHHPTMEVGYDYCVIRFTTHAVNGLTKNDFICAAKIDKLIS